MVLFALARTDNWGSTMNRFGTKIRRAAAALVAGCAALIGSAALAAEHVNFMLDFTPYGKHAFFYAALDHGFWQKAGFDVTILKGEGSGTTIAALAAKATDFAFADTAALIVARTKGAEIKVVGVIHEKALYDIGTLKGNGINAPKDLEGKRIGAPVGDATRVLFPAFAQINNVDESKVIWVSMTPPARAPSLIAGQVDAVNIFATETPTFAARAKESGKEWQGMLLSDYGLDLYSAGILVRDEDIATQRDKVKRFVQATMEAVAWSVENPEDALKSFLKYNPAVDPTEARGHFHIALDHLMTDNTKKYGVGFMTQEKMQHTVDVIAKAFNAPGLKADDVYSNAFLPEHLVPKEGHLD